MEERVLDLRMIEGVELILLKLALAPGKKMPMLLGTTGEATPGQHRKFEYEHDPKNSDDRSGGVRAYGRHSVCQHQYSHRAIARPLEKPGIHAARRNDWRLQPRARCRLKAIVS
jgi:hypothetical protein